MDIDKSLCDNLCGKRVIEFPRLLVIPVHLANTYLILSKGNCFLIYMGKVPYSGSYFA